MADLVVGQFYLPDSADVVRDDLLTDFRLEALKYTQSVGAPDPAVQPGTDNWFWATAQGNAAMLQYSNLATLRPAMTPLFASGDDLETWRLTLRLPSIGASPSSGKLTVSVTGGGTITVPDGKQFVLGNGLRGQVSGTHLGVTDGSDVAVVMVDKGAATNAAAGTKVRFVDPPFNLVTEAKVSVNGPLTGGYDAETESRKRERVLNRLGAQPKAGNWSHIREIAFNALASVQDCYVYPALGGPSSCLVAVVKQFDRDLLDFHRAMGTGAVQLVRDAIHAELPGENEHVVCTVTEQAADLALYLTIPASVMAGGNGQGWVDQRPWPPHGSGSHVTVTAVTNAYQFTVDAATSTAPIPGLTHVAWWSPQDMAFHVGLITAVSGSSGAWVLTVDAPMVDKKGAAITPGDYVSPPAVNGEKYGTKLLDLFETLGAGEMTSDIYRLPRSLRHPLISDGVRTTLQGSFLAEFTQAHAEISNSAVAYAPTASPSVPSTVDDTPNVLVPRHFGIYLQ